MERNHIFTVLILALSLNGLVSCSYGIQEGFLRKMSVEKRSNTLELVALPVDSADPRISDNKYNVLVLTDVHFGKDGTRCEDKLNAFLTSLTSEEMPAFCICLGDIADHGLPSEFEQFNQNLTKMMLEKFNIKTYSVAGNHDLYNSGWEAFTTYCQPGSSFYRFETAKFSWYFLDSASCSLGNYQFEDLKSAFCTDSKKKLIFTHVPLYANNTHYFVMQNTEERNKIISLCAKNNVKLYSVGHTHLENHSDFGAFKEENLPGFLENHGLGLLMIDETAETAEMKIINLDDLYN